MRADECVFSLSAQALNLSFAGRINGNKLKHMLAKTTLTSPTLQNKSVQVITIVICTQFLRECGENFHIVKKGAKPLADVSPSQPPKTQLCAQLIIKYEKHIN